MSTERPEEKYVRDLFQRRFGVVLRKIPESKLDGVKTPDFELLDGAVRAAVIEVKYLERTPRTTENGWHDDEAGSLFKVRKDNATKRVGALIHNAWKQLYPCEEPKVLVFVNDETVMDVGDLDEAYNGFMPYGTDETGYIVNKFSAPIANGRIRDEKKLIDLYIWVDKVYDGGRLVVVMGSAGEGTKDETRTEGPTFRCTTQPGYDLARRFFQCPELDPPAAPGP